MFSKKKFTTAGGTAGRVRPRKQKDEVLGV
jgi:hypothetical protein